MADALVSTPVALTAGAAAALLIGIAGKKIKNDKREDLLPLMGVTGAFIFAAQMVNFSIPGTGSSGHVIGGVLLAALLGPWAAFITLVSVLLIQSLLFADGGLLALGCNILNMGACTCLVAYPLVYKPLMRYPAFPLRLIAVSVLACTVGLELGALGVVCDTELSGVTALPAKLFLGLMGGIHLFIGIGEGIATGAVLWFIQQTRPSLLVPESIRTKEVKAMKTRGQWGMKKILVSFAIGAVVLGAGLAFLASTHPDGLEWSIQQITGDTELASPISGAASEAARMQSHTALMPGYENVLSGVVGALVTLTLVWATGALLRSRRKTHPANS